MKRKIPVKAVADGTGVAHDACRMIGLRGALLAAIPVAILATGPAVTLAQSADDAATACREAAQLIDDDDLDAALEEASWCVESLRQLERERTLAIFPDESDGWTGGTLSDQSAMGMTIIEREYTRAGETIGVSLTTGAAGTGLAALAQMGMSMGGGSGRKMRIDKRTVIDMSEPGGGAQLMVQLKSGGVMNVSSDGASADDVETFLRGFPIASIDDALMP